MRAMPKIQGAGYRQGVAKFEPKRCDTCAHHGAGQKQHGLTCTLHGATCKTHGVCSSWAALKPAAT